MRLLLLTNAPPAPARQSGGAQRSDLLLRALEKRAEVDLLLASQPGLCTAEQLEQVRSRARLVDVVELSPRLWGGPWGFGWWRLPGSPGRAARALAVQAGRYRRDAAAAERVSAQLRRQRYDAVVARYLRPALRVGLPALASTPVLLDVDDVDADVLAAEVAFRNRHRERPPLGDALRVRELRRLVARALPRFDHCWFASEADRRHWGRAADSVLPNVPWSAPGAPPSEPLPPAASSEILFVGTLAWEPNRAGLDRFVRELWPRVRGARPDARLRVVGSGGDPAWRARMAASDGVEMAGFVAELRPAYARAAFTIAPLDWGGGPKLKLLESLAQGRSCVASGAGLRGLEPDLRHGVEVWRGSDDDAMVEGCLRLLREPQLRDALAAAGSQVVRERYGLARFEGAVCAALERVVPGARPASRSTAS